MFNQEEVVEQARLFFGGLDFWQLSKAGKERHYKSFSGIMRVAFDLENERILSDAATAQDRAYTAEVRVRGLEEERQRLQARVDELQQGLRHLFVIADTPVLERAIAKLAGHRVDCDWLLDGACTCGGTTDSKATKGQGDHYPKEKAVSE